MGEVLKHPEKTKMTEENKGNTPVHVVRAGTISASVWENENESNGKKFKSYSVTTQKSYKDKNDKWKESNSLMAAEVPKMTAVLQQAYEWIISQKREEKE